VWRLSYPPRGGFGTGKFPGGFHDSFDRRTRVESAKHQATGLDSAASSQCGLEPRRCNFCERAGFRRFHGLLDLSNLRPQPGPASGRQDHDRELPAFQTLLVAQVPVGGDHNLEATGFSRGDQITVGELLPAELGRTHDFVFGKKEASGRGTFWSNRILTDAPTPCGGHGTRGDAGPAPA
jgi:hypothetical protein